VDRIFTDELGWMFTRNQVREYGIDGHALVVRGDSLVTRSGHRLAHGQRALPVSTRPSVVSRRFMIVAARLVMAAARLRRAPAMGNEVEPLLHRGLPGVVAGPAPAPCGRISVQRPGKSSGHSAGGTRRRRAWALAAGL
jgi:hypothetical protein